MNEITTYQNYESFKAELDRELMQEAAGFVRIGYLLRVAQDTNILDNSGYASVNDFAYAEYGLDKSQVSRFIAINERFSEGGYSDRLEEQYQNFGVAKLGIMLQLPDAVNEQLTPDMTKSEINAIKEEVKEEEKISDLEVMCEEKSENSLLWQVLDNVMREHPDIFKKIWEENKKANDFGIKTDSKDYAEDVLAAAGEALYTTRVSGVGKVILTIKCSSEKLIITNIRTGEITEPKWEDLAECLRFKFMSESAEKAYKERYDLDFPKEEEEPKQPKAPAKVITTPKKEPAKSPTNAIKTECEADFNTEMAAGEENGEIAPVQQAENVIKTECDTDSEKEETETETKGENEPEKVEGEVEEANKGENEQSEMAEKPINPQCEADSDTKEAAGKDIYIQVWVNEVGDELNMAMDFLDRGLWNNVAQRCKKVLTLIEQIEKREDELEDEE